MAGNHVKARRHSDDQERLCSLARVSRKAWLHTNLHADLHSNASEAERVKGTRENSTAIGVESSEKTVRWLYDHHFAAIVGDTVAFEAWPPNFESGWCLHEWLLVHFGTPIGEMWNLEKLSAHCEKKKRYTFFLTSAPLHVKGGVGSPPGAIAIF